MRALLALVAIVVSLGPIRMAEAPSCEFTNVSRVVAVGDVHGAYDQLVEILRTTRLIDNRLRWAGGKAHLVQVGDLVDRGPDSRKVLDFYRRLERDASSAGGRVHVLLGNHEVMRLIGDYRYVTPEEYQAFANGSSATLRANFVDAVEDPELKKHFASQPLGALELIQAFGQRETYGAYLRTLNAVVRINGVLFVHGGISPVVAPMTCTEINDRIRRDLTEDFAATRQNPEAAWSMQDSGPLWYRGLAMDPSASEAEVNAILDAQHVRAMVIAHTPQVDGRIRTRFDGRVILIDTGMQPAYVPDGRPSALEIVGDVFTAIYKDRHEEIARLPALSPDVAAPTR